MFHIWNAWFSYMNKTFIYDINSISYMALLSHKWIQKFIFGYRLKFLIGFASYMDHENHIRFRTWLFILDSLHIWIHIWMV